MGGTGKNHAQIKLDIWGDDDWLDLSPRAQHLYFVLWTSPGLSFCGAGDWHPGRIANRARGWTAESVEAAAAELSANLFLVVDTDTDEYLLRSWIKHDGLWRTPNMAVSVANARAELASRTLRGIVVFEVAKIRKREPDSTSWTREAVAKMLEQKAIDAADLTPYNPTASGAGNPDNNGASNPTAKGYERIGSNPTANPAPTPAPSPSPTPSPEGGYVTGERHQALDSTDPPPPRCPQHLEHPTERPCRACGDARATRERWDAAEHIRRAEAASAAAREHAAARQAAVDACAMCDDDGYRDGRVCDHDPDGDDRAARGMAMVRAALSKDGDR